MIHFKINLVTWETQINAGKFYLFINVYLLKIGVLVEPSDTLKEIEK